MSTIKAYHRRKNGEGTSFSLMKMWKEKKTCNEWYKGYMSSRRSAGTMVYETRQQLEQQHN
jgi:hypothetical protein